MSDFAIKLIPGITLSESTIESIGEIILPGPSDHEQVQAIQNLLKHKYPKLYKSRKWGFTSFLGHKKIVISTSDASVSLKPKALSHHVWDNTGNDVAAQDSADLSYQVTNESSVTWEESGTIGVQYSVGIEVGFGSNKATASTQYSMSVTVGHSTSHSQSTSISSQDSVAVDVPPNEIILAMVFLQTGIMIVKPIFEEIWSGHIVFYNHSGHPGPVGEISGEELSQHANTGRDIANINIGFATEEITRTRSITDTHPETVQSMIDDTMLSLSAEPSDS